MVDQNDFCRVMSRKREREEGGAHGTHVQYCDRARVAVKVCQVKLTPRLNLTYTDEKCTENKTQKRVDPQRLAGVYLFFPGVT